MIAVASRGWSRFTSSRDGCSGADRPMAVPGGRGGRVRGKEVDRGAVGDESRWG